MSRALDTQMVDLLRPVKAKLAERGKTAAQIDEYLWELFAPAADEAMTMHYVQGKPYEDVDVWYLGACRAKLVEEGFAGILPPEAKK